MPGLTSRKRRAVTDPEGEEDERPQQDEAEVEEDQDEDEYGTQARPSRDMREMVKGLVRLALAAEYQRRPLRRQEVGEKVLVSNGRLFKKVFTQAQEELRAVFGMELVELPAKERVTAQQKRAATQKGDTKPVASWMLCSVLPEEYRQADIIPPSAIPDAIEESKYTAIYTLLVSMIALNGGSLPESKLDRYLARLGMDDATPVAGYEKTEKLLKRLEKDGYLVKVREQIGTGGEEEISWTSGPRAKVEIGDAGIQGLVEAVYGNPEGDEAAELTKKIQRSLGVNDRPDQAQPAKQKKPGRAKKQQDDEDND